MTGLFNITDLEEREALLLSILLLMPYLLYG